MKGSLRAAALRRRLPATARTLPPRGRVCCLQLERDPGEAEAWYRRAADAGDVEAMVRLGRLLEDWDRREAGRWYQKAAASGDQSAKRCLKRLYPLRHSFMHRPP